MVSSTLPYYGIIDGYSNWYVSTIVLFYILFPVIYAALKRYSIILFIACSVIIAIVLFKGWVGYDITISRIPIFMIGILIYLFKDDKRKMTTLWIVIFLMWNISISYHLSIFLQSAFITPLLMALSSVNTNILVMPDKARNILQYLGSFSYEIFLSNHFVKMTIEHLECNLSYNIFINIGIYAICTLVYGYVFIQTSKLIKKLI